MLRRCFVIGIPLASIGLLVACGSAKRCHRHEQAYQEERATERKWREAMAQESREGRAVLEETLHITEEVVRDSLSQPTKRRITLRRQVEQRHQVQASEHQHQANQSATTAERHEQRVQSLLLPQRAKTHSIALWLSIGIIAIVLIYLRKPLGFVARLIKVFR